MILRGTEAIGNIVAPIGKMRVNGHIKRLPHGHYRVE